jgi:hypothetical protein
MKPTELPAWILVNLVAPLITPVAVLLLVKLSKKKSKQYPEIVFESLRYGALFWSVLGMCAAAIYDAWNKGEPETLSRFMSGVSVTWHIALIIISSGMVLLGTMDSLDESSGANDGTADRGTYRASIWASVATAASYGATHYFYS